MELGHFGNIGVFCGFPLTLPARQLSLNVGLFAAKIAKSDCVHINVVNCGKNMDQRISSVCSCFNTQLRAGLGISSDDAIDEIHDVKGCVVDIDVVAVSSHWCNRNGSIAKGSDDSELTAHVVRCRKDVTEGRSAQNPTSACGVGHVVGQVRESASDQFEVEWFGKVGDALKHPASDVCGVDSSDIAWWGHIGSEIKMTTRYRCRRRPRFAQCGRILGVVIIDVTDETLEAEVLNRSLTTPVVVDLWAPWCGPCKTLGPMIEAAVSATGGKVVLAKINVDENPAASQAFKVQSIPAVFAISGGKIVDQFVGALPEEKIIEFVNGLIGPVELSPIDVLREQGDEASLRQALELEPDNADVIIDLAELLAGDDRGDEALELLSRIPETPETRRIAAYVRSGSGISSDEQIEQRLEVLLGHVKDNDDARQEFIDLLELLGSEDPRTGSWRKRLTTTLF